MNVTVVPLVLAVPPVAPETPVTANPALGAVGGTLSGSLSLARTATVTGVSSGVVAVSSAATGFWFAAAAATTADYADADRIIRRGVTREHKWELPHGGRPSGGEGRVLEE